MDLPLARTTTLVYPSLRLILAVHANGTIYTVTATMTLKGKGLLAVVGIIDFLHVHFNYEPLDLFILGR